MEAIMIGILMIVLLLALVLLGVHVAVALSLSSVVGIWLSIGDLSASVNILSTTAFHGIRSDVYGVIPLFVLMGLLANLSGVSTEIFNSFHVLLRRLSGGLGMATVGSNAVFSTVTGVSVASAAVFSKIALEPMMKLNYDKKLALGAIAGSSVLGMLIPPSLLFIIYGMLAKVSVGKLFIAGVIPGLLLALVYCIGIYLMGKYNPKLVGGNHLQKKKWDKEDIKTIFKPWAVAILVIVALGGIYTGVFTPTEAGGVGAFGALLLVIVRRKMDLRAFWDTLIETGYTSASVLLLLIAAQMYSRMLSMTGVLNMLDDFVNQLAVSPTVLLIIFMLILLLLGMVIDSTSILLISMPLMLPFVEAMGYDLIAFGVIAIIVVEMGLLTPPFGLVVYSMSSALGDKANIWEIFRGSFPFVVMMAVVVIILFMFPSLSTWLPSVMD